MTLQGTKIRIILLTLVAVLCAYGRPSRIVVVTPTSGDPIRSGTDLLSALAGITAPSATNPWLLKIEPGVYDLGAQALTMRPYVDVEGSGSGVTIVRSAGDYTVVTANNAELRQLTALNTNPASHSTGQPCDTDCFSVLVGAGVSAKLTDVAIVTDGLAWGLSVDSGASAEISGGSITLPNFGFGVLNIGTAEMDGTRIHVVDLASDGISNSGTLQLTNAKVEAEAGTNAIVTGPSAVTNVHQSTLRGRLLEPFIGGTINIGASQVIDPGPTSAKCAASYNATFDPLGANCQPLP